MVENFRKAPGKLNLPRFGFLLAAGLGLWLWPSVFAGKAFLPLDLLWQCPPHTPPAGIEGVHNFLIGDMLYENFAWKTLLRRCVSEGELPSWNPYAFCGHPLLATGQASTFYPFNVIFLLIPLPYAYVVFTGLHLWLAGVFQYLFLRRIGVGEFGAAVGGIVFALCGFFAMRLIWPMLLGSAVWLPLMLLCIVWLSESESFRQAAARVAGGAVVFALPLLSGFFEIAFYGYFVAGVFTLAQCWHLWSARRSLARCAGLCGQVLAVMVMAAMVSGPQLLPFLEVKDLNVRAGEVDYDKLVGRALKAEHLLPVIIPDFFGNPGKHHTWDLRSRSMVPIKAKHDRDCYHFGSKNYSENSYYIGLLPLALAILSLRVRGHYRWFLYGLLILSLSLAFGTRIYALLFYTVPGFEQVRTPFRWMYPATFAVASLAAIGAGGWQRRFCHAPAFARNGLSEDGAGRRGRLIGVSLLAGPIALLVILLGLLAFPEPAHRLAERAIERIPRLTKGFGFLNAWDLAGFMWANLFRFAIFALAAVTVLALPYLRSWRRRGAVAATFACLTLVAVDPGLANYPFSTHSDPRWLDRTPPSIQYLQHSPGIFRVARFGSKVVLHPNLPALYGLHDVGGYDSVILADYARYLDAIEPQRRLWWNQIIGFKRPSSLDSPLLSLLNIRYLLADPAADLVHPHWELVFEGAMRIYRNRRERPRAFMVHHAQSAGSLEEAVELIKTGVVDPAITAVVQGAPAGVSVLPQDPVAGQGRVDITRYGHTAVELATSSPAAGIVVLCDMMYAGWRAYLDDRPGDILKVDGIFRGVCVPAGDHRVLFRFEPESLWRGWIMLCSGLVILGAAVGVSRLGWARERPPIMPVNPDDPPEKSSLDRRP